MRPDTSPHTIGQDPFAAPKKHKGKRIEYSISILFNLLFLYVANNLLIWKAQFITEEWSTVLGIINVVGVLNVVFYAIFLFYDRRIFYFYARILLDVFAVITTYRLYTVFPFDFNGLFRWGWLNGVFPWLLLLGLAGIVISIIVRTVRFMQNKNIHY